LPLTTLLGREADVRALRQSLAEPTARLTTLIGPGGVGKTRLALEVARGIAQEGSDRVVFVPLGAIRDPAFVASAIAEALGLANVTAIDLSKRVRVVCGEQPTWLVLDNFEQVLDAAPLVADLLSSIGSLRVLVTSRAPLRVRGEREHVVGPLTLDIDADAMSLVDLARAPAVRLFVERVRDVQPGFRLTAANSSAVVAICRRLDALPLALELAAPWIKMLAPEELLRRLALDTLMSSVGPRDLPERQQTMNATVGWSYQLLSPSEQRLFRRLGAVTGCFGVDAAAAVLGGEEGASATGSEALSGVASLIDKSLLLRSESSESTRPLYQMLETVRAYAALELVARHERDDAMAGLIRYCTGEAVLARDGLVGPEQVEWLYRVRNDLESYRSAMSWLLERGRSDEASHIASALKYFWLIRGHAVEGLWWYEQILRTPSLSAAAESMALAGAALMWYTQGEFARARTALDRAGALARAASDRTLIAQIENQSGHVERAAGNGQAARTRFTRSLKAFRDLNVPSGAGHALTAMAAQALADGDEARAERLVDEAASVLRDAGPWFLCFGLGIRALLAVRRGKADEAIAHVRDSLEHILELNDTFAFVYMLVPLAVAAVLKGSDTWAARILGLRDSVAERTGAVIADASVHDLRLQTEREVRERLGAHRWAQAYKAGRALSLDAVLQEIENEVTTRHRSA
jgi:predicted ATPase